MHDYMWCHMHEVPHLGVTYVCGACACGATCKGCQMQGVPVPHSRGTNRQIVLCSKEY